MEECVLIQDTKVARPNSTSFLPNSLILVFLEITEIHMKRHSTKEGVYKKKLYKSVFTHL